jgi:hypothetical protein
MQAFFIYCLHTQLEQRNMENARDVTGSSRVPWWPAAGQERRQQQQLTDVVA